MTYPPGAYHANEGSHVIRVEVVEGRWSSSSGQGAPNGRGTVWVTRHFDDRRWEYVAVESFETLAAARAAADAMQRRDWTGVRLPSYGESDEFRETYGYRVRVDGSRYDAIDR